MFNVVDYCRAWLGDSPWKLCSVMYLTYPHVVISAPKLTLIILFTPNFFNPPRIFGIHWDSLPQMPAPTVLIVSLLLKALQKLLCVIHIFSCIVFTCIKTSSARNASITVHFNNLCSLPCFDSFVLQ